MNKMKEIASNDIIIIKYNIDGEFIDGDSYEFDFMIDKSSLMISTTMDTKHCEYYLNLFDGHNICVKYRGISKIDNKKIFVLNIISIKRDIILNNIGIE